MTLGTLSAYDRFAPRTCENCGASRPYKTTKLEAQLLEKARLLATWKCQSCGHVKKGVVPQRRPKAKKRGDE